MGIGCHRDPLEANVWYVKAADQSDERAKNRIATIRAAADGTNPSGVRNGSRFRKSDEGKCFTSACSSSDADEHYADNKSAKQKRFVIF